LRHEVRLNTTNVVEALFKRLRRVVPDGATGWHTVDFAVAET